jgi:hypothetical protein
MKPAVARWLGNYPGTGGPSKFLSFPKSFALFYRLVGLLLDWNVFFTGEAVNIAHFQFETEKVIDR